MASRRTVQSNGAGPEGRAVDDDEEKKLKKHRKEAKAESDRQQRNRDAIRWGIVAILLVLAAVGLYLYLTHYQTDLPAQTTTGATSKSSASKPKSGSTDTQGAKPSEAKREGSGEAKREGSVEGRAGSKASSAQAKGSKAAKTKEAAGKDSKTPEAQKKKGKSQKPKTPDLASKKAKTKSSTRKEKPIPQVELSEIGVLRRPVGPTDPDKPYVIEILMGDNLLKEERWSVALEKFNEILKMFPQSPRALYGKGVALENLALEKKSNKLMDTAIDFYSDAGLRSSLTPKDVRIEALLRLSEVSKTRGKLPLSIKALEKVQEIGAEDDAHKKPSYANRLGLAYLAAGQKKKALKVFQGVVKDHEGNSFAKAHIGFILFTEKKYDEALPLLLEGLRKDGGIRTNAKFYLYAGECLTRLNRTEEAFVLYGEAMSLDLFPSLWQRSLYNEAGLRAQPYWSQEETGYGDDLVRIERALETIRGEAVSLLDKERGVFPGDSTHFVLFSKGKKVAENCRKVPKTCTVLESFPEAIGCKRGSVQLLALLPGTHVFRRTAPSNTKLQALMGVAGGGVRVRVAEEARTVEEGGLLILDDSFDTELWQLGSKVTVILSLDMWHPDLSEEQTRQLGPI